MANCLDCVFCTDDIRETWHWEKLDLPGEALPPHCKCGRGYTVTFSKDRGPYHLGHMVLGGTIKDEFVRANGSNVCKRFQR